MDGRCLPFDAYQRCWELFVREMEGKGDTAFVCSERAIRNVYTSTYSGRESVKQNFAVIALLLNDGLY